jgi:hypothetical protein
MQQLNANVWLYVFGFAKHILRFKAQKPIGKTDIYNVLTTGGFNPPTLVRSTKKIKRRVGKFKLII